jgi:hypothetical protein
MRNPEELNAIGLYYGNGSVGVDVLEQNAKKVPIDTDKGFDRTIVFKILGNLACSAVSI